MLNVRLIPSGVYQIKLMTLINCSIILGITVLGWFSSIIFGKLVVMSCLLIVSGWLVCIVGARANQF